MDEKNGASTGRYSDSERHRGNVGADFIAVCNLAESVPELPNGVVTAIKAIRRQGEWLLIVNVDDNGHQLVGFRGFDDLIDMGSALHRLLKSGRWKDDKPWEAD